MNEDIVTRDLKTLWHPCSQMKDYESFPPLHVIKARGSYLYLKDGRRMIDSTASWWCKNLGHAHPRLQKALLKQSTCFEHVILANTTNDVIVSLSEKLTQLTPHLNKVCYASDGSCAIEIALKMTVHARQIRRQEEKKAIFALSNGYHGETLFALAVSDVGLYRHPYQSYLPKVDFIPMIPYVASRDDPIWADSSSSWPAIEAILNQHKEKLSAIIVEPIIQGAGGMRIYSQDFLRRLGTWSKDNDVYLIADEVMTGFGRSGKMLACEHAHIHPDLLCLGKGLTGGVLPMSAVLLTDDLYQLFYDDYDAGKSFLHSHTYTGNALAAAVALECLAIIHQEDILQRVLALEHKLLDAMQQIAERTQQLTQVRAIGGLAAADLIAPEGRRGYRIYRKAVELGALLRPLGNTLYWLPPLTIQDQDIEKLAAITLKAITSTA